jgi:ankyrin repeat protein
MLTYADVGGHLECLLTLLAGGSRVNASDKYGFRALHGAALHGHSGCVEALVMMGAHVNAPIHDGKTAAYLAAMKGK